MLLSCSCMSTQKATAYLEKSGKLSKICGKKFPPRIEYKQGQTITKMDTAYLPGDSIPCPPDSTGRIKYIQSNPRIITKIETRIDTVEKANTVMEDYLRAEILRQQDTIGNLDVKILLLQDKFSSARKWNWYLGGFIGLLIIGLVVRLYLKSKNII